MNPKMKKFNLPGIIRREQIDILVIDEQLGLIAERLKEALSEELAEYGLTAQKLFVTRIIFPE